MKLGGTISGYNYNPKNGLFDKGGDIALEGSLSNVIISVSEGSKFLFSKSTNAKGEFGFELPLGSIYTLTYVKNGYEKSIFEIDLVEAAGIANGLNFKSLELILNSYFQAKDEKDISPFGIIKFNNNTLELQFIKTAESGGILKKKIEYGPAISLIEKSISKNAPYLLNKAKVAPNNSTQSAINNSESADLISNVFKMDSSSSESAGAELIKRIKGGSYILSNDLVGAKSLDEKKKMLLQAKEQLAEDWLNAETAVDTLYLLEREALILSMESDLKKAEEIIALKENELSQRNKIVWLFVLLFLIACVGVGIYFWMWRKKKRMNELLTKKDKKIHESLIYAQKIQQAVLPNRLEVNKLIPDSFILYLPKDIVSGDFYWVKEVGGRVLIASVDCTGHGVPGAFMSMIGNTLMNQIILEEGVSSPKMILQRLDEEIRLALKQSDTDPFGNQDGMDMSICSIDRKSMKMTYAGAMNPIYRVSKNRVEVLDVSKIGVGGMKYGNIEYEEFEVNLEKGESIYMMSDGYMDQFGGTEEKFNLPRFKSLLAKVYDKSMKDQAFDFEQTLKDWQGSHEQTDDILVIGVKID